MFNMEIANGIVPTLEAIQHFGDMLCNAYPDTSAEEMSAAVKIVQSRVNVVIKPAAAVSFDYHPWVSTSQAALNPYYWKRYEQHLSNTGKASIARALDRETLNILDLTSDPTRDDSWDRRGLVLGNVQSGKTANYTGLICKAADAGFKVIIVLAGIQNNLRNQTQERIDEGFIGSQKVLGSTAQSHKLVGVGLINNERRPTHFTSKAHDFTKTLADSVGMSLTGMTEPGVFVVKKNQKTLRSLIKFLKDNGSVGDGTINESLLLIDDEADNASINVAKGGKISTINGLVRDILQLFDRSAYIGYTATPFANIFIDPGTVSDMIKEDLFPRSFIVSLDAPTDYFGATKLFLESPEAHLRGIDDYQIDLPLKHKIDTQLSQLPESLVFALQTFVLTRAIRILRLQGSEHSSMLVNVSRFNGVQFQVQELIDVELTSLKNSIRISAGLGKDGLKDAKIAELRSTFDMEFADLEFDWHSIQKVLWDAVAPIETVTINSKSTGKLNYDDYRNQGRHVIAIGGFSLSRGLTLEGLTTSYFLRNSVMYDTLLQMGRWFGYRPDYEDLCKVWLTPDAIDWYSHIARAVEELRDDLRRMQQKGGTPEDFGLKVRSHPDNLVITARNKLGTGEDVPVSISLTRKLVETATIHYGESPKQGVNALNLAAVERLIKSFSATKIQYFDNTSKAVTHWPHGHIYKNVPRTLILKFLDEFQLHDNVTFRFKELNRDYIQKRGMDMDVWDVFLPTLKTANSQAQMNSGIKLSMNLRTRSGIKVGDLVQPGIQITSKARVGDALDESAGLSLEQFEHGINEAKKTSKAIAGAAFRAKGRAPLLIVHLLAIGHPLGTKEPGAKKPFEKYEGPYVAYGLSYPEMAEGKPDSVVTYTVNETYRQEHFGFFEDDDLLYEEEFGEEDA